MHGIVWSPGVTIDELEKAAIKLAFSFYGGNKTITANALGISVRTLDNKLEKYEREDEAQKIELEEERERKQHFLMRARGLAPVEPTAKEEPAEQPEGESEELETPRSLAKNGNGKNSTANKRNG